MLVYGTRARHVQDGIGGATTLTGGGAEFVRVELRRDGFASIGSLGSSWTSPGVFSTKPLVVPAHSKTLFLNARSDSGGSIQVEIQAIHDSKHSLHLDDCVSVEGDVTRAAVSWLNNG